MLSFLGPWAFTHADAASVKELSAQADAVVVGTVKSWIQSPADVKFDLQVVRALKGGPNPGAVLNVAWEGQFSWPGGVRVREPLQDTKVVEQEYTGLWFLRKADRGWSCLLAHGGLPNFLSLFYLAALTPPSAELTKIANDPALAEVIAAVESRAFGGLGNPDPFTLSDALPRSDPSSLGAVCWHILRSGARSVDKTMAMATLAGSANPEALKALADDPSLKNFPDNTWVIVGAIRDGLRTSDRAALQNLMRIARSEQALPDVRAAAVWALKSIHTRDTVPFLASLLTVPTRSSRSTAL